MIMTRIEIEEKAPQEKPKMNRAQQPSYPILSYPILCRSIVSFSICNALPTRQLKMKPRKRGVEDSSR